MRLLEVERLRQHQLRLMQVENARLRGRQDEREDTESKRHEAEIDVAFRDMVRAFQRGAFRGNYSYY